MATKRALIVDDSKSARVFLSRILDKYQIDVDTAESAEVAIEYLGRHRPDVIFMDHLMPGMDGFQAVQAIKSNPRTATIPIMMYTSQEGELYLGQARALGAVGVLPKQIRAVDVSKVLYELGLLPDRRSRDQTTFTPASDNVEELAAAAEAVRSGATLSDAMSTAVATVRESSAFKTAIESAIREQVMDLRRFFVANLENSAERIVSDVRTIARDLVPPPPEPAPEPPPATGWRGLIVRKQWPWLLAASALALAIALGALWGREIRARQSAETLAREMRTAAAESEARARDAIERAALAEQALTEGSTADVEAAGGAGAASAMGSERARGTRAGAVSLTEPVPYGEVPLAGPRLEALRGLLNRLDDQGARGVVEVRSFPGRFCLVGGVDEGFSVAADDTPQAKCDLVGNPFDESLAPAQRESVAFANIANELRRSSQGALQVQAGSGPADTTVAPYPTPREGLTAGEWNRAARANNRVEIRFRPAR